MTFKSVVLLGAMTIFVADSPPAAAEPITVLCSGELRTWGHNTPPLSTITDQTMRIDLESGKVIGIINGKPLNVTASDQHSISFAGLTLFGLVGSGQINRLSGEVFFMAPASVAGVGGQAQVTSSMLCRPARAQF